MMHIIAELHRLQDAHQQIEDALFDWCIIVHFLENPTPLPSQTLTSAQMRDKS